MRGARAPPGRRPGPAAAVERADAARNRERILKVAAELVACRGIDHVSMQEIAREAHVGTGTVYRRFGDRAGLALALLQADEAAFQERTAARRRRRSAPALPPLERLRAFGVGYLEHLEQHAALIAAADARPARRPRAVVALPHAPHRPAARGLPGRRCRARRARAVGRPRAGGVPRRAPSARLAARAAAARVGAARRRARRAGGARPSRAACRAARRARTPRSPRRPSPRAAARRARGSSGRARTPTATVPR